MVVAVIVFLCPSLLMFCLWLLLSTATMSASSAVATATITADDDALATVECSTEFNKKGRGGSADCPEPGGDVDGIQLQSVSGCEL